jgi:hypothetical protein
LWTHWGTLDSWALALRARERGVLFIPETLVRFAPKSAQIAAHGARIAFSRCTPDELRVAIDIVAREARALGRSRHR